MSERSFRLIQGLYILLALYFEMDVLILAYLAVIAIEGLTNWRIPVIVNRLRYGKLAVATDTTVVNTVNIEGVMSAASVVSAVNAESAADSPVAVAQSRKEQTYKFNFEAERLLRLVVFTLLIFTVLIFPESGWFFPWFIGAMLFMAGVTNICPMVMLFRYLGFR